jgi:hypothetical protein
MDFLAKIPKEEIIARITLLQTQLSDQSISAALFFTTQDRCKMVYFMFHKQGNLFFM